MKDENHQNSTEAYAKICWKCGLESGELEQCPMDGAEMEPRLNLNPKEVLALRDRFRSTMDTITVIPEK